MASRRGARRSGGRRWWSLIVRANAAHSAPLTRRSQRQVLASSAENGPIERGGNHLRREAAVHVDLGGVLRIHDVERLHHRLVQELEVPEPDEGPARPEGERDLRGAALPIDPVPGVAAGDEVEAPAGVVPLFEAGDLDADAVTAGDGGHARIDLDPEDREASPGE
jgi:hypothetical protein